MKPNNLPLAALFYTLIGVGFLAMIAEPNDDADCWLLLFFGSKIVAAAAFYAAYRLNQFVNQQDHEE